MSCRDCAHFAVKGENDKGRAFGMCKAWGFSINENDDKGCTKKETSAPSPASQVLLRGLPTHSRW